MSILEVAFEVTMDARRKARTIFPYDGGSSDRTFIQRAAYEQGYTDAVRDSQASYGKTGFLTTTLQTCSSKIRRFLIRDRRGNVPTL